MVGVVKILQHEGLDLGLLFFEYNLPEQQRRILPALVGDADMVDLNIAAPPGTAIQLIPLFLTARTEWFKYYKRLTLVEAQYCQTALRTLVLNGKPLCKPLLHFAALAHGRSGGRDFVEYRFESPLHLLWYLDQQLRASGEPPVRYLPTEPGRRWCCTKEMNRALEQYNALPLRRLTRKTAPFRLWHRQLILGAGA